MYLELAVCVFVIYHIFTNIRLIKYYEEELNINDEHLMFSLNDFEEKEKSYIQLGENIIQQLEISKKCLFMDERLNFIYSVCLKTYIEHLILCHNEYKVISFEENNPKYNILKKK